MALFSRKKEEQQEAAPAEKAEKKVEKNAKPTDLPAQAGRDLSAVIIKPHITEKAVKKGEQNVYTFIVRQDATKFDVRDSVKQLFNVTPVRVNIVNKSPRSYISRMRGRRVTEKGQKKAYVYLKSGDSIELA